MNKITCYFNSNKVYINKNDKIIEIESKAIRDGDIVNKDEFIKEIKRRKLFSNIFINQVDIYLNKNIEEKDILYYKLVFEDLNCNKINIYDTSEKLISPTLINSKNKYILYYNNKYYKIIPELLRYYLNIYKINTLRIISNIKLPINNKTKYYYYNYKNDYFIN